MSEVRASNKDQCGDGGENHGSGYNILERVGQTASNAAKRARTRTKRWSLIWLWKESLVLWSGYKIKSPVVLGWVVSGSERVVTAKTDYFLKNVGSYKVLSLLDWGREAWHVFRMLQSSWRRKNGWKYFNMEILDKVSSLETVLGWSGNGVAMERIVILNALRRPPWSALQTHVKTIVLSLSLCANLNLCYN